MKYIPNEPELKQFFHNLQLFFAPLAILYLSTVVGTIQQSGHLFVLTDLIPTQMAQGGLVIWILNAALDYYRKLK